MVQKLNRFCSMGCKTSIMQRQQYSHLSRSHCIFTIKLVQSSQNSNDVFTSNLNFCNQTGSERLKKTLNLGDRLKESNQINTSVIQRCMENTRKRQQIKDKRLIPFRESKLTQRFQKALMSFERIEMIVNRNPSKNMFLCSSQRNNS